MKSQDAVNSFYINYGRRISNLRPGDIVSIKVIKKTVDGWQISIGGKLFPVKSDLKLTPDQILKAKILQSSDGVRYEIKLLPEHNPVKDITVSQSSKDIDPVIKMMLASGIPLLENHRRQLASLLEGASEPLYRSYQRIVVLLYKMGLSVSLKTVENFFSFLSVDERMPGLERRKTGTGKEQQEGGGDEAVGDNRSEQETAELSAETVKNMLIRKDDQGSLLQLFNHAGSRHDSWIVLPISADSNRGKLSGAVKLYTGFPSRTVITVSGRQGGIHFVIDDIAAKKKQMTILCENGTLIQRIRKNPADLESLSKALEQFNIVIRSVRIVSEQFDGFENTDDITIPVVDIFG